MSGASLASPVLRSALHPARPYRLEIATGRDLAEEREGSPVQAGQPAQGDGSVAEQEDGSATPIKRHCAACSNPIQQPRTGRHRQFCSDACRQLAYRRRQQPAPATAKTAALLNAILGSSRR